MNTPQRGRAMGILKTVSAVLALSCWTTGFVLWYRYAFTRPDVRQPDTGRVFPLNTHGTVVYLNSAEHLLLYSLITAGVVCFLVAVGFYAVGRRVDHVRMKDNSSIRKPDSRR